MTAVATEFDFESDEYQEAIEWLRNAHRIVVFTGAGISAESGIPTFRDSDGLWRDFPPEKFASWRGLLSIARREPRKLARFLRAVVEPIAVAAPNTGHRAIENLEHHRQVSVVTQNIDGLHQAAGNTIVHEVHGSLLETVTIKGRFHRVVSRPELRECMGRLMRAERGWLPLVRTMFAARSLLGLNWRGVYRPRLVLFGDALAEPDWTLALKAVETCDLLIVVGTSAQVYPAAMLPAKAKKHGARIIGIDPVPVEGDLWLAGRAGEILPRLVQDAFEDETDSS